MTLLPLDPGVIVPSPDKIMVAGDWHGNSRWAELCFQHAYSNGANAIVQVGDFGFWVDSDHTREYLKRVERASREWEIPLFWIDGNHEDHSRTRVFNDSESRPNTIYLPRGYRWNWWGKRFMALGGAYSVDRFKRTERVGWWPEEELSDHDIDYASRIDGTPVDVVFAHDCPTGVFIPGIGADAATQTRGMWPDNMLFGALAHRDKVRTVWKHTDPQLWIHGHYHRDYTLSYEGTKFTGLGCDGDQLDRTVVFLEPGDLL